MKHIMRLLATTGIGLVLFACGGGGGASQQNGGGAVTRLFVTLASNPIMVGTPSALQSALWIPQTL